MKSYLIIYNLIQTIGWSYTLYKAGPFLIFKIEADSSALWHSVEIPLKIFQTAALIEILHSLLGIVKTKVFTTSFQIIARLCLVWGILDISPPSQTCIGLPILTVAWCTAEIVRYAYYVTNLLKIPSGIEWLRYSLFIVLYPIGISGEIICAYYAIGYVQDKEIWTHLIPNFGLSFYYVIFGVLILFIALVPNQYMHMLSQRRKILEKGSKRNKSK